MKNQNQNISVTFDLLSESGADKNIDQHL